MADFTAERSDVKSHEGNRVWEGGIEGERETKTGNSVELSGLGREVEGGGSRKSVNALFYMGLHSGSSCFVMNEIVKF